MTLHHGLTQAELATALGVSRQTIIAIEREPFDASLKLALRLALLFGEPVEEIFALPNGDRGLRPLRS